LLERDRQTVTRALRNTTPDGEERGQPRWKMSTIVGAMERHSHGGSSTGNDPELMAIYSAFNGKYNAMVALPTLPQRRAAARRLAPDIEAMDRACRQRGRANGHGDELADLRADQLFCLTMRGFEAPCEWSSTECWEQLSPDED
jgi:hypothetical protein